MIRCNLHMESRKWRLILFSFAFLILLCSFAPASHSQMFSLWGDEQVTTCETYTQGSYFPFSFYIFLEPGDEGAIGAEFKMIIPESHFSTVWFQSPVVSDSTTGVWYGSPGISMQFTSCQTDMFWIACFTMMAPNTTPAGYWLYPHDDTQLMGVKICSGERPWVAAGFYTCFTFNDSCWNCGDYYVDPTAVSETTWGAIKAMHR